MPGIDSLTLGSQSIMESFLAFASAFKMTRRSRVTTRQKVEIQNYVNRRGEAREAKVKRSPIASQLLFFLHF